MRNRKFLIILVVTTLIVAATGSYALLSDTSGSNTVKPPNTVDYSPPTKEEKQAGNKAKKEIVENETERTADPEAGEKTVNVVITDAGQYGDVIEVRAFTPDILEKGTCTITFRQGDKTVQKDTPAYPDARTTICTSPEFKRSGFPTTGEWSVTVRFVSPTARGQSEAQTITIQ